MKNCNSINKLVIGLFVVALFASCEKEYVPIPAPPVGDVSYMNDMQPFFNASCNITGCHDGGSIPLNLLDNVSYNNIIGGNYIDASNASNSKLYTKIISSGSMANYATSTERSMTLLWIEQGAKNN